VRNGPTTYMVTGGGGDKLRGGSLGFHNAIIFKVRDDCVQTRLCVVPHDSNIRSKMEYCAFVIMVPFIRAHPYLVAVFDALCVTGLVLMVRRQLRLRKKRKQPASVPIVERSLA